MSIASKKVPIAFVTGIICLGLGIAGGIVAANFIDKETKFDNAGNEDGGGDLKGGKGGAGGKGGFGGGKGGGGKGGGGKGGGGGGFFGPKLQLTTLVTKLDILTKKPLSVELTADQKKQLQEQLAGLDTNDTMSNEEAQAKLDAIAKIVESHRATLEAAGVFWPGGGIGIPPKLPDNPLKEGAGNDHLKSLRTTLGK
jgi:hypothetical protein